MPVERAERRPQQLQQHRRTGSRAPTRARSRAARASPESRATASSSSAVLPTPASPVSASTPLVPRRAAATSRSIACCSACRPTSMPRVYERRLARPGRTRGVPGCGARPPIRTVEASIGHHEQKEPIMSITAEPTQIDTDKLMSFVFRAVDEVGATLNAALVVMGDKLGYYRDLAEHGPTHAGAAGRAHADRRAVRARVAERAGGRRLRHVRPRDEALHAACRARARDDRPRQPGVPARVLPDRPRHRARHPAHRGCRAQRRRLRLAPARHRRARRVRAVLPPELPRQPRRLVDPRARRRAGRSSRRARSSPTSAAGTAHPRSCSRRRSRTRRSSAPTTTPSRSRPRRPAPPRRACDNVRFEVASAQEFSGIDGLRPGRDVRLPARHGRPGRRRAPRARGHRRRRHLDDRRADGRRPRRRQPQPGRPRLLRLLDAAVHARRRSRRTSGSRSARRRVRRASAT